MPACNMLTLKYCHLAGDREVDGKENAQSAGGGLEDEWTDIQLHQSGDLSKVFEQPPPAKKHVLKKGLGTRSRGKILLGEHESCPQQQTHCNLLPHSGLKGNLG